MKRILAMFLILVMCLCISSCGKSKGDVQEALQGTWVAKWTAKNQQISRYYTFKDDTYTTGGVALFGNLDKKTGTYEIKDDSIHLIPDDGSEGNDLDYTYNKKNGEIALWWNDDVQFEKGKVNVSY